MSSSSTNKRRLNRRLLPLYLASFFQTYVLWYAIQRLFMQSIGFDNTTIGLTIALSSAVMLLTEIPAGILADRWSRKGSLILFGVSLAAASLIGGLSQGPFTYMISAVIWGMAASLYSGTHDSIIYDTVLEETGTSDLYKNFFGKYMVFASVGAVLGALTSGVLVTIVEPRTLYLLTVPLVLLSLVFLLKLKEPSLHKKKQATSIKRHLSLTITAVLRNRAVAPIVIVLIFDGVLVNTFKDFSQLWWIALAAPEFFFGLAAALLASVGIIGSLFHRIQLQRIPIMCGLLLVMVFSTVGLIFLREETRVLFCQLLVNISLIGVFILFSQLSHDTFDSHVRASASSTISMISKVLIIPFSLTVGYTSKKHSIFDSGWLFLTLALVMSFFVLKELKFSSKTSVKIAAN